MKLIVGLGNPGTEYERSRHNVGWMIADAFAKKFRIEVGKNYLLISCRGEVVETSGAHRPVDPSPTR